MSSHANNRVAKAVSERGRFWISLLALASVFAAGAALTWRKWPDLIVDYGLQLYIPWRLSQGAVLYRDLFYMAGGPLSQYWHALLFKIFGVSFRVIIISNLTVTALLLLILHNRFRRMAGALCGFVITLAVICVFCFGQFTGIGNANYAAPYSHEMLHGLCLSIAALALTATAMEQKQVLFAAAAGSCFGLVALTKPDIFLALTLTSLAVSAFALKSDRKFLARCAVAYLTAASVPLLACLLLFARVVNWPEAGRLEFFGWRPLLNSAVVNDPFYQWCLGLDDPFGHLRTIALQTLVAGGIIAASAWLVRQAKKRPSATGKAMTVAWGLLLVGAAWRFNWTNCGAVLPVACVVTLALLARRLRQKQPMATLCFPLLWTVFSLLLLAKQGVFPRIWQTGFALAMPALITTIYLLGWELPRFLEERHAVPARPMRFYALAVLAVALFCWIQTSAQFYRAKQLPVGHGADAIIARGPSGNAVEARTMNQALDWIATNLPPQATLAAIPEGLMLNYLSRHANSTPCLDWNPTMLAVFGETNFNAELRRDPPDYVALVEWEPYQFNTVTFGDKSYGGDTLAWVRKNYQPVALFGSEPLRNGLFGIQFFRRNPDVAGAPF